MNMTGATADDFLAIGPRIRVMPIIHGSGDFAIRVREELLARPYDCVAVPLPPSFQDDVEAAIEELPRISVVVQVDAETDEAEGEAGFSYVPIDPCQGVIAALADGARRADRARVHRPGDAAVRGGHGLVSRPVRAQAGQPRGSSRPRSCPRSRRRSPARTPSGSHWMAARLRELEARYRSILLVCSILDWPWIRDAYVKRRRRRRSRSRSSRRSRRSRSIPRT